MTHRAPAVDGGPGPSTPGHAALDHCERGSGTVLALGLIGVVVVLAGLVAAVGASIVARHRAEAGADLAALAVAASAPDAEATSPPVPRGDCNRARVVAVAGGGGLAGCWWLDDGSVVVEVVVPVTLGGRPLAVGVPLEARARARAGQMSPTGEVIPGLGEASDLRTARAPPDQNGVSVRAATEAGE